MKKMTFILSLTTIVLYCGCSKSNSPSTTSTSTSLQGNWQGKFNDVGGGGHSGNGVWQFFVNSQYKMYGIINGYTGADSVKNLYLSGTIDSNGLVYLRDTIANGQWMTFIGQLKSDTIKNGSYNSSMFASNGKWIGKKK